MAPFFETFVIDMLNDVPTYVYILLICLLFLFAVISILLKGRKKGFLILLRFALIEYLFLLFCFTIIFRTQNDSIEHHLSPFRSYAAYDIEVRPDLLPENILNVVVFMPLGLMMAAGFESIKWWQALLVGLGFSVTIEALQYLFNLGVSEFDDVFHNTIGCIIGYGILKIWGFWLKRGCYS